MIDVDVIALTAIEQKIGLRRPAFRRRFIQLDRWLVADTLALSKLVLAGFGSSLRRFRLSPLNSLAWLELPRLDFTKEAWAAARKNRSTRFRLPLVCSALYQSRGNLRSFYLRRGLTIKLFPPGGMSTRDVEARALIASAGNVSIPRVIASGLLNDRGFIVEQLVAGHHPGIEEERITDILLPAIWANYRAIGFGTVEAFPSLPVRVIEEELVSVPIPEHMTYERECRDELIRRIKLLPSTTEHPLLTAFGHGDLAVGNIVVTSSGDFFVIDWEHAGQMPIAWDLRKLIAVPGLLPKSIELLRAELQQLGCRDAMSAEGQFLLETRSEGGGAQSWRPSKPEISESKTYDKSN